MLLHLSPSVRPNDEHWIRCKSTRGVGQQVKGGRVGPLQVIECNDERGPPADGAQKRGHGVIEAQALLHRGQRVCGGELTEASGDLGSEGAQNGAIRPELVSQ